MQKQPALMWAFKVCPWPITSAWKTMEKEKEEQQNVRTCAKLTCLDAVIGGHSEFLLVTGDVAERDDNCCPAMQSFEK